MTAKEWLNRARTIDQELQALNEAHEVMVTQLTKATQTLTGDTVQSTKDPHAFDRLGDLAMEIQKATKACHRIKAETLAAIMKLDNTIYRRLLIMRYINGHTFEEISCAIHYSYKQTCRLHGRALIEISEVLKNERRY